MDDERREMFFEYERLKAILEDLERKLQAEEDAMNDGLSEDEKRIAELRVMAIREEIESVKAQMRDLHP